MSTAGAGRTILRMKKALFLLLMVLSSSVNAADLACSLWVNGTHEETQRHHINYFGENIPENESFSMVFLNKNFKATASWLGFQNAAVIQDPSGNILDVVGAMWGDDQPLNAHLAYVRANIGSDQVSLNCNIDDSDGLSTMWRLFKCKWNIFNKYQLEQLEDIKKLAGFITTTSEDEERLSKALCYIIGGNIEINKKFINIAALDLYSYQQPRRFKDIYSMIWSDYYPYYSELKDYCSGKIDRNELLNAATRAASSAQLIEPYVASQFPNPPTCN